MTIQSILRAACMLQCVLFPAMGYAQILDAKPAPWISQDLPKADSAGWIHLFDGKRLYGCAPAASDLQAGRVRLEGSLLHLDSAILHFDVDADDVEVRARLKKVGARALKLTVRNTTGKNLWRGCATFFEGGDRFGAGKNDGTGWKDLAATTARKRYAGFFDLDVLAQGDKLTVKADEEEIYSTAGSSVDYGGVRFFSQGGTTLFERIELRILDKGPSPREQFAGVVLANFAAWDKNGDGGLQEQEINRAIQDPNVKSDAAAAAAALKRLLASDEAHGLPPLTRRFFQSNDPLLGRCAFEFRRARKRLQDAAGLPLFAQNSPTLAECRQRGLGDCYLVAVLGAAIQRDSDAIRGMITTNANAGGYHVRFPDGTRVDVPDLTEGELAWIGAGAAQCLWQRLLEKSWGLRKICRTRGTADPSIDPFDTVSGGSGENMLLSMTGHETVDYYLGVKGHELTPLDALRVALKNAVHRHRLAEAFTWKASGSFFPPNHAFAVLGYDADSDSIRLWNPLGGDFTPSGPPGPLTGYQAIGGQFTMPVSDLPAVFAHLRVETDQPAVVAGPKVFP